MKILFLPQNIASMPAITAACLNKHANVTAKCITQSLHKYQQKNENVILLSKEESKYKSFKWLYSRWKFRKELKKWIEWADILHYTWSTGCSNGIDLKWANDQKKIIFVEWIGSEIRDPDYLKTINPYYKYVFENGYEYAKSESKKQSQKNQKAFSRNNAKPLLSPEMTLFVDKSLFGNIQILYQRINLMDFTPQYPAINNNKPLIVHSPTAKIGKGSNIIVPLIEELKKQFNFDFILLHDMSREKVLEIMQKADIFIDQIIVGSYGMAAMEAMSFGKPVMCYLMPEVFKAGLPEECPIVNTNPDNLKEQLITLITNAQLRHDTGIKSRAFAEKFHDVEKVSSQLLTIYKAELEKKHHAEIS